MPTYILNKGDIIVKQSSSISATTVNNPYLIFGEVVEVSDLEDKYTVGDIVLYNSAQQLDLSQSDTPFYLIKNTDILFIDDNGT